MDIGSWSEFLTAHGPWPVICAAMAYWIWTREKRLDQVNKGYQDAMNDNTRALTELTVLYRERGRP